MRGEASKRTVGPLDGSIGHRGASGRRYHGDETRILIVDDDRTNLLVFGSMLRRLGYQFDAVTDGHQAVEAVKQRAYAAVLMDCLMPEMDGFQATWAIRCWEREAELVGDRRLPIVAVTAVAIRGARERCIEAGMDDYLAKPVVIDSLEQMLDRWVRDASAQAPWSESPSAAPDRADAGPLVDPAILEELFGLEADGGGPLLREILHDFAAEIAPRFPRIREALGVADDGAVREQLHFIAGCAAMIGAVSVERIARSVDLRSPHHAPDLTVELVDQLESTFEQTCTALGALAAAHR